MQLSQRRDSGYDFGALSVNPAVSAGLVYVRREYRLSVSARAEYEIASWISHGIGGVHERSGASIACDSAAG